MSRHVGFGVETTYGTAVASTDFTEAVTETLQTERTFEEIATIRAESTLQVNELNSRVTGDVEMLGNYQDLGLLLKHFIGSVDTTSSGGVYVHTFPDSSGLAGRSGKSLTVEVQRDSTALTWRYAGCKVVSWSLSATLDQSPRMTFGFIGKSEATGTATTASYPTFDPMLIQDMSLSFDNGSTTVNATSVTVNATYSVDEPNIIGSSVFAAEPIDGALAFNIEAEVLTTALTDYNRFDGTTAVDAKVTISDATHSLVIDFDTCRVTAAPTNISGKDRLMSSFSLQAYGTAITAINLTNDDATIP